MRICTRCLLAGGAWLTLTGATVGDPVANKSAKAHELYQGGEYDKALNLYRDALVDRPEAPELHFNVGDALFKSGDYEKALQEFEQALKIPVDRARAQAHYNIGNTLFQQQDYEKAIEAYGGNQYKVKSHGAQTAGNVRNGAIGVGGKDALYPMKDVEIITTRDKKPTLIELATNSKGRIVTGVSSDMEDIQPIVDQINDVDLQQV